MLGVSGLPDRVHPDVPDCDSNWYYETSDDNVSIHMISPFRVLDSVEH